MSPESEQAIQYIRYAFMAFLVAIALLTCMNHARTEEPPPEEVCVKRQKLIEHQNNLSECHQQKDQYKGRLAECRDSVEPLQVRIEKQAADNGKLQQRNSRLKGELNKWYRNPWIWGAIGVGLAGGGYAAGQILD